MEDLKVKILDELENPAIPDIAAIFSDKSLTVIPEILKELLKEERKWFKELLSIPKTEITFSDFEHESKLSYLYWLLNHYESVNSSKKLRKIIDDFRPEYMDFINEISFNKDYYGLFIYCRDNLNLDAEERRIVELEIQDFEKNWIHLASDIQDRIKEINKKLSELSFNFSNNKLDSENDFSYLFESVESIKEMPESDLEDAKSRASEKWLVWWLFLGDYSSYVSVMRYCSDRDIRKHFYVSKWNFATEESRDNRPIALEILKLRKELANLLWYSNYAEYSLSDKMAKDPKIVFDLVNNVNSKAKIKWKKDLEELVDYFGLDEIKPWDTLYYSRVYKQKKLDIDERELRKYFEFERTLNWLFDIASKLYSVEFLEIQAPKYDDSIRIYEARRWGKFLSYFILDPFYRKWKKSWAWADDIRHKFVSKSKKTALIAVNVCSFQKSAIWESLLDHNNAWTLFHEFGHALHLILSESDHADLSWFNVEWDFVELPSQIMENWCNEKESLNTFAIHNETKEPIPDSMHEKLKEAQTFMSWIYVCVQNMYSMFDMEMHTAEVPSTVEELDDFSSEIQDKFSLYWKNEENRFHAGFSHIFDWGYAAWYYSYLWAEIIEADVFSEFKKTSVFDKDVWDRFYKTILSKWAKKPAQELFRDFMWRDVSIEPFFERQGF